MHELELKFRLDEQASSTWQALFAEQGAERLRLQARYFDTPDGRLAAAKVALRLRLEGRHWVQTLKAAGDGPVKRLEHEVPIDAGAAPPQLDLLRHAGTEALDRLRFALGGRTADLVERYATDVWRSRTVLHGRDGAEVEAALDIGHVRSGTHEVRIAELELEHLAGPMAALFERAAEALAIPGMWLSTVSKAEQGENLLSGRRSPAAKALPLQLPAHAEGAELLRAVLLNTLDQVLRNGSEVAEGLGTDEHVHQLRVGLRRLRTALRDLAAMSHEIHPEWEATFAACFSELGAQRDHDVVADAVRPLLEAVGAPKLSWSVPASASTVSHVVRQAGLQRALVGVLGLAHASASAYVHLSQNETRATVAHSLGRLHRQLLRGARAFTDLPLAQQHRVRKRLKRLRYLSEFAMPLWPAKSVKRYIDALKPSLDALGWHADCAAAAACFAEDAKRDPAAQFAAGYLKAHLQTTAHAVRKPLKRLARTPVFWR